MIRELFLPNKIGKHLLFSQRILAFDIGRTHVSAAQLMIHAKGSVVEKIFNEPLEADLDAVAYEEKVSEAIATIMRNAASHSAIYSCIPASTVIFKQVRLPFADQEKIKRVITFEVEPLLPFALSDAVLDFMIMPGAQGEVTQVLVVAAQKAIIDQHLGFFGRAGVLPDVVTVDMLGLATLYNAIPSYTALLHGAVLVDIGYSSVRVASMVAGQFHFIRAVPKGIGYIAQLMQHKTGADFAQAFNTMIRYGLDHHEPGYAETLQKALLEILHELQFALQSTLGQDKQALIIDKILLAGGGAHLKGLAPLVAKTLGIHCELFDPALLAHNQTIAVPESLVIPKQSAVCLGVALTALSEKRINLYPEKAAQRERELITKQMVVGGVIAAILLILLSGFTIVRLYTLRTQVQDAQQVIVEQLKEHIKHIDEEGESFDDVFDKAKEEVEKLERLFLPFAPQGRSFLRYILEFKQRVEDAALLNKDLDFKLNAMTITRKDNGSGSEMTVDARVKNRDALITLEAELAKSKLMKQTEGVEKPEFVMKLDIIPERGGGA